MGMGNGKRVNQTTETPKPTAKAVAGLVLIVTVLTLAVLEVALRVADFRMLREGSTERSLSYRFDPELGWAPIANSSSVVTTARTIHATHNSLGLRDVEFNADGRPRVLFLGDSFVWGLDAEANERFTDILRARPSAMTSSIPGRVILRVCG